MVLNPSGLNSNSSLLSVPRACVFAALLDENDIPIGGFEDLGVIDSAEVQFETEEAEKYSSCGEQRVRLSRITTQISATLSMEVSSLLLTKVKQFLMSGTVKSGEVDQSGARTGVIYFPNPEANDNVRLDDAKVGGRHYKLWVDGANRVFAGADPSAMSVSLDGVASPASAPAWRPTRNIFGVDSSTLAIYETTGGPSAYTYQGLKGATSYSVSNNGFTVNEKQGTIFIPNAGALEDKIKEIGADNPTRPVIALHMEYDGDAAVGGANQNVIQGLAQSAQSVALRFEQQDTSRPGWRGVTELYKVRLTPSGGLPLVSDGTDFASATLEGSVEKPAWMDDTDGLQGFYHAFDDIAD